MLLTPTSTFLLDETNAMPLYMQLVNSIKAAITTGQLKPGDAVPSERTLMAMLKISRGTARKAFQKLLEDGIIIRNQGSGTFVAPHIRQSLPLLESFSEMAQASGGKPQSELVGYLRRPSTEKERQILQLTDAKCDVVELTRVRKINGIAISLQMALIPASLFNNINELGESLYLYLADQGAPVIRATQRFLAVGADSLPLRYLNIKENEPLLLVIRTGFSHNQQPVEHTFTWCLNEYYDFTIELHK
ncbi:GntR family transcriptional regulator [Yersinia pekkanenii]|uniref:Transcriptional regulator n=1 Tax=Yersinia pekkanenii TaxID=1288385 RepID=A0A0T9RC31_9GAMM|nr:GntR family transcriptional regulator [Yersinia pekkanenii]CNI55480.1 transcriptional regulator [Yersinia pekkanenii]CRY67319.1 transcriptional regulator [Yersinia pekkanenii]